MSASASSPQSAKPLTTAVRQRLQQLFEHGKKSFEKGDCDYAHDMFAQCVAEDPASLIYLQHLRANLARRQDEGKKASLFGGNRKAKSARGSLVKATERGAWEEAFTAGCEALKQAPGDVATLIELAEAAKQIGATECRLYYLKWALDTDPKHEQANRRAAAALAEVGQFDQAIACLKRVQELKPEDQEVARSISRLSVEQTIHKGGYDQSLLQKGKTDRTPAESEASPTAAPRPTAEAAEASDEPAEPEESREEALLSAIRLRPAEVQNYIELAELYAGDDRLHDAQRVLTKALTVSPGDLNLRERYEEVQLRRAREQAAVAERQAQAEGTPQAADLARRLQSQANQTELEVYAARVERSPDSPHDQFELGLRLKRAGKYREAIQAFQAARGDTRRLAETQLHLGECFQKIEQFRLAMGAYRSAISAASDRSGDLAKLARYRAGVLATGLGELDEAEKLLTALAEVDFGYRDVADRLDKLAKMRNT